MSFQADTVNLSTFYQRGISVLLICCYRIDGTRIAITVKCLNLDTMRKLVTDLHDYIESWIVNQGRKLNESDNDKKIRKF